MTALCYAALRRAPLRHTSPTVLLSATLLLLLLLPDPVNAVIYTTPITTANVPAVYGSSGANAVEGLYQTCLRSTNASATQTDRMALTVRMTGMASLMADTVGVGTYYIAGYYDAALNGWYWNDGLSGTTTLFGQGPTCTAVNGILALQWAAGYPRMATGTSTVGTLRYMAYSSALKGWVNVAGTATYDGVVCESQDDPVKESKKFPWWAILIIVIGSVVVIAVVVLVIVCCCCGKKEDNTSHSGSDEEGEEDEMEEKSFGNSRNGSFDSRGARYYVTSGPRGSFLSNGSSYSGTRKKSALTGTTENTSYSYSVSPSGSYTSARSSSSDSYSSYSASSDSRSSSSSDPR